MSGGIEDWFSADVETWTFKPTLWQRVKLRFKKPVYVGVDIASGVEITVEAKSINGRIVITSITERQNDHQ